MAAEPFFPIPDVLPPSAQEDTAEVRKPRLSRRRPKRPPSAARFFFGFILYLALVLGFASVAFGAFYFRHAWSRLKQGDPSANRIVILNVAAGERFPSIVKKLEADNLLGSWVGIPDRWMMWYLTKTEGNSDKIQAGSYRLTDGMSLAAVYARLLEGSQDFKVTIPEGKPAATVAALVAKRVESFDKQKFLDLTEDPRVIADLGFDLQSLEGYLFPSTYFYGPGMSEEELVRMMVKTFKETVEPALAGVTKTDSLSFHDHIVMASLIEREARTDAERPVIASVLFNRLAKGMPLQVDATVQYAVGDFARPPRPEDMKTESPYNTYLHKGLPPGPICNPGLASIMATFKPEKTDYLFYVYKGDKTHAFAKTFEEHRDNVRLFLKGDPKAPMLVRDDALGSASQEAADGGDDKDTDAAKKGRDGPVKKKPAASGASKKPRK